MSISAATYTADIIDLIVYEYVNHGGYQIDSSGKSICLELICPAKSIYSKLCKYLGSRCNCLDVAQLSMAKSIYDVILHRNDSTCWFTENEIPSFINHNKYIELGYSIFFTAKDSRYRVVGKRLNSCSSENTRNMMICGVGKRNPVKKTNYNTLLDRPDTLGYFLFLTAVLLHTNCDTNGRRYEIISSLFFLSPSCFCEYLESCRSRVMCLLNKSDFSEELINQLEQIQTQINNITTFRQKMEYVCAHADRLLSNMSISFLSPFGDDATNDYERMLFLGEKKMNFDGLVRHKMDEFTHQFEKISWVIKCQNELLQIMNLLYKCALSEAQKKRIAVIIKSFDIFFTTTSRLTENNVIAFRNIKYYLLLK